MMPRWPAFVRQAWRPSPLLADIALALLLAAVSLLTVETGTESSSPVRQPGIEVRISPPAEKLRLGDSIEIRLRKAGKPVRPSNVEPLLTIQNTSTGEWKTYAAKPTREPGRYRVPAAFPGKGFYSYSVLYGPFEQNVKLGEPTEPRPAVAGEHPASGSDSFPLWPMGLTLLATLPIGLRRRYPMPVLAVTLTAGLAMDLLYNSFQFAGAVVALYTVAAYVGRPESFGAGVGTALALPLTQVGERGLGLANTVGAYVFFAGAWLLGDRLAARRAHVEELEERALRLEREREESERRAAAAEQERIARELHDIIAHNVSVMTVQAAAAGDVFETQPRRVREALSSIESTGREALTELRRLLGSVRTGDLAPQPSLTELGALLEQVRGAGLAVELSVEGDARALPASLDLSAYRIVQEALTNTLKHARATHASVLVRYADEALEVEILDDGTAPPSEVDGGHGLIGMRERTALFGGELEAGPAPGGGFSVHARIPLGSES